ncbi:hypothetical protein J6590_100386 [Homalodisca vitripennis]|nr:hypothetical protein J6590_100386 [Homalodisca vitripennis]
MAVDLATLMLWFFYVSRFHFHRNNHVSVVKVDELLVGQLLGLIINLGEKEWGQSRAVPTNPKHTAEQRPQFGTVLISVIYYELINESFYIRT